MKHANTPDYSFIMERSKKQIATPEQTKKRSRPRSKKEKKKKVTNENSTEDSRKKEKGNLEKKRKARKQGEKSLVAKKGLDQKKKQAKKKKQCKKNSLSFSSSNYGPISVATIKTKMREKRKTFADKHAQQFLNQEISNGRLSIATDARKLTKKQRKQLQHLRNKKNSGVEKRNSFGSKKERKRPRFQLKLPSNTEWSYCDVPWYGENNPHIMLADNGCCYLNNQKKHSNDKDSSAKFGSPSLPTQEFSPGALQQLSDELKAFAKYVSLTEMELETRHDLIQLLTDLAGKCYSSDKNIEFQCFGSFATPEICTFGSDVDLALWGIVPVEKNMEDECTLAEWHEARREQKQQPNDNKIQKWREVLNEFYEEQEREEEELLGEMQMKQNSEQEEETSKNASAATSSNNETLTPNSTRKVGKEMQFEIADENSAVQLGAATKPGADNLSPLFVIDRNGDGGEIGDAKETVTTIEPHMLDNNINNAPACKVSEEGKCSDIDKNAKEAGNDIEDFDAASVSSKASSLDSADKLENFSTAITNDGGQSKIVAPAPVDEKDSSSDNTASNYFASFVEDDSSDEDSQIITQQPRKRRRLTNDENLNDEFEVSFHSNQEQPTAQESSSLLNPKTRKKVVRALGLFYTMLRKHHSYMVSEMELRRRAKVPIVYLETKYGFEVDIAVGGHQGMDTSQLAETLVKHYKSFSPVVLFLKVLLTQQDLDKPFTGGLGSYKLYVLVAHHLEHHLEMGGNDDPGEVLLSFLCRFGCSVATFQHEGNNKAHSCRCYTSMTPNAKISCRFPLKSEHEFYEADLQPCHLLDDLILLLQTGWNRLSKQLLVRSDNSDINRDKKSFLVELIRPASLQQQRQKMYDSAIQFQRQRQQQIKKEQQQHEIRTAVKNQFIEKRLRKRNMKRKNSSNLRTAEQAADIKQSERKNNTSNVPCDPDESEILKGYNIKGLDGLGNLISAGKNSFRGSE